MDFDAEKAVAFLDRNKAPGPTGHCARYVRLALEAGGLPMTSAPVSAKDYTSYLKLKSFAPVEGDGYKPETGDVVVIQPCKGSSAHGHIAMYDGKNWVSDFEQKDMWGGDKYRKAKPSFTILRFVKPTFPASASVPELRLP